MTQDWEREEELVALIDGDILRYEVGFAAEAGWRVNRDPDSIPPWEYVRDLLRTRIENIVGITGAENYSLYLTEGHTFRYDLATVKPYKGTRKANKPWHFDNLTVFMKYCLPTTVVTGVEADDAMAHLASCFPEKTIICSRDKDLRQVPVQLYSWELGKQPSFGPELITEPGYLTLTEKPDRKLTGTGFAFFCSQVLTGDSVDNIPGLPGCGPVAAYELLSEVLTHHATHSLDEQKKALVACLKREYERVYGGEWKTRLTEQGQLCWLIREFNPDGSPVMWTPEEYIDKD